MAKSAKRASKTPRKPLRRKTAKPKESSSTSARRDGTAASRGRQPDHPTREESNQSLDSGLYVVSTPIGNLEDMTLRAIDTLKRADHIACEDTRVTGKLLKHFGITTPTKSYNDHNGARVRPQLLGDLSEGKAVALVSDAGTPLISDPGLKLVQACARDGVRVFPVPGASAVLAGLVTAGLPIDRFMFCGFLPAKTKARQTVLRDLATIPASLVFYESGPRLAAALADMDSCLGSRQATIAREMTKLYEEITRGTLKDLTDTVRNAPAPKGECVLCIGPPEQGPDIGDADVEDVLREALETMSVKDACAFVSDKTGRSRKTLYATALTLKSGQNSEPH